ncbi:enoyl-CoA hydratase-related protein [Saccharopolyspora sp. ASAGF58]|uniref:enoyl-CoA hydratase-related protein n=1 Tax=Saccharopolyspora sp. ASAGF58 TaxID=2719023 RepID=UPI00143FD59A|nr:hypothetical protein FDZ84_24725 [Saccharopolyspora sp. ASAGF58]
MCRGTCGELNGSCAGLGLAIALHADVRFVATEAKLTTAFVERGLIGEHGISWLLPRIVGRGRALDLLLSARVSRAPKLRTTVWRNLSPREPTSWRPPSRTRTRWPGTARRMPWLPSNAR